MFNSNKSTDEYFKIINYYKEHLITGYSEKHDIIPKSLGGSNTKNNTVRLPANEHFRCHQLLVNMVTGIDKSKMWYALWRMMNPQSKNQIRSYIFTDIEYEIARKECAILSSIMMTGKKNPFYGKKHSDVTKQKMSNAKKNKTYEEIYGEQSEKMRNKRKEESTGRVMSLESRERMSINAIGKKKPIGFGDKISKQLIGRKKDISIIEKQKQTVESRKQICNHCNRIIDLANFIRWHGDKCKRKLL